ncbi:MAG: hypothetical protein ACP5O1_02295 [Phycisphaerae bacterium]
MKSSTGLNSVIPVWCTVAMVFLTATFTIPSACAAAPLRASVIPRHPHINSWAALILHGLPLAPHRYQIQIRNRGGGPISEVTVCIQRPILIPIAFITAPIHRYLKLQYRLLRGRSASEHWQALQIRIRRRLPGRPVKTFLRVTSHRRSHLYQSGTDYFLPIGAGALMHTPLTAVAAFSGCVISDNLTDRSDHGLIRRVLPTGIPIFRLGVSAPPPVDGIAWTKVTLPTNKHPPGWRLAIPAPPSIRPIVSSLRRLRLPPPTLPAVWSVVVVACGFLSVVIMILVWNAAGRRRAIIRVSAMLAAGLLTGIAGTIWISRAPPLDTIEYHWRQAAGEHSSYLVRWRIYRAMARRRFSMADDSALPVAWSLQSWKHLRAVVRFSLSESMLNRIDIILPKGGAAVTRSEYFYFHQAKAASPHAEYYFIHGGLEHGGHTIGLGGWISRQPQTTAASIRAWLLFGRQGYLHWRLTAYPHFEVEALPGGLPHRLSNANRNQSGIVGGGEAGVRGR